MCDKKEDKLLAELIFLIIRKSSECNNFMLDFIFGIYTEYKDNRLLNSPKEPICRLFLL